MLGLYVCKDDEIEAPFPSIHALCILELFKACRGRLIRFRSELLARALSLVFADARSPALLTVGSFVDYVPRCSTLAGLGTPCTAS